MLILASSGLKIIGPRTAHAGPSPTNVIQNPSFENGLYIEDVSGVNTKVPTGWSWETCEGVKSAIEIGDSNNWTDGQNSTKVTTGPVTPNGCFGPPMLQSATCLGSSQLSLSCPFNAPLATGSVIAFCMGMSGTGNSFSVSDNRSNTFSIKQEVVVNVHVACGYSTTYTSAGGDDVTFTFHPNSFSDFAVLYEVTQVSPVSDVGPCSGSGAGQNFQCDNPISVAGGPPFVFALAASTSDMGTFSPGKNFFAMNISPRGNAEFSSSSLIANTSCPSSNANNVTYGMACVFLHNSYFQNRGVGFSQFRQNIPGLGYNFTNLTNDPAGFSFWFKLEPYNATNGMAAFEVRVFGAESLAELDYVFNADPSVGQYQNSTNTHSLIFNGYQYGQWYHFSRNLSADWLAPMGSANTPLNLNYNFTLLQFQGFSTRSGSFLKSETFWLDDVRLYAGPGTITPETHYTSFSFTDANNNLANNVVQWTLNDAAGTIVPYTLGQSTLAPGPYYARAYYPTVNPSNLIQNQQVHLDQGSIIPLALYPNNIVSGGHVALDKTPTSLTITTPDNSRSLVDIQGPAGTLFNMIADVPVKPVLIQANGQTMTQGYDWTYDAPLSIVRINFSMPSGGENITILFQNSTLIPTLSFVDQTGYPVDSRVNFSVLNSRGVRIPYQPGAVLPSGTNYLEVYYAGSRFYRNNIANIGNPTIMLEMIALDTSHTNYLAINSTASSITPIEYSSAQVKFSITGSGPYLAIIDVAKRPLYVEVNGVRTPDWVYNDTTKTVAISSPTDGTFLAVLEQPPLFDITYVIVGIIAATAIVILVIYYWRRSRASLSSPRPLGMGR